jgi:hypothetical protein
MSRVSVQTQGNTQRAKYFGTRSSSNTYLNVYIGPKIRAWMDLGLNKGAYGLMPFIKEQSRHSSFLSLLGD